MQLSKQVFKKKPKSGLFIDRSKIQVEVFAYDNVNKSIYDILHESNSLYMGQSHMRMKSKIIQLNKELVMEATRNIERIQHFRKTYQRSKTWPIGQVLYTMRSKFARMIRLYTLSLHNLEEYNVNKHLEHLSEIQRRAMDIYAEAEILEEWEERERIKKQEKKEEREYQEQNSHLMQGGSGLLRSATKHRPKLAPKKQTSNNTSKVSKRGSKLNANPLQSYDGFDSDIN